jgi:TatD DNase family protein
VPNYIDSHCHLADPRIAGQLDEILARSREQGITAWVQGGVDPEDWTRQRDLKKRFPKEILTSYGLHPWWVAKNSREEFDQAVEKLAQNLPDADGLGEIGLDYGPKIQAETHAHQQYAFRRQLELLKIHPKPLVLHIVRAHPDASAMLGEFGPFAREGIIHSFSGTKENARKYLDLGLSLSISGGITRKGFESSKKAVTYIPLDRLLVETDSPDQPLEGQILNEPTSLIEIARVIAKLRAKESAENVLLASATNVARIFRAHI